MLVKPVTLFLALVALTWSPARCTDIEYVVEVDTNIQPPDDCIFVTILTNNTSGYLKFMLTKLGTDLCTVFDNLKSADPIIKEAKNSILSRYQQRFKEIVNYKKMLGVNAIEELGKIISDIGNITDAIGIAVDNAKVNIIESKNKTRTDVISAVRNITQVIITTIRDAKYTLDNTAQGTGSVASGAAGVVDDAVSNVTNGAVSNVTNSAVSNVTNGIVSNETNSAISNVTNGAVSSATGSAVSSATSSAVSSGVADGAVNSATSSAVSSGIADGDVSSATGSATNTAVSGVPDSDVNGADDVAVIGAVFTASNSALGVGNNIINGIF